MNSLQSFLSRVDFNKIISDQRSRDGLGSLFTGLATGLALGYFTCVCAKQYAQSDDEADMRRKRVGMKPSARTTIPTDTVDHTLGFHRNARGMVMCNQQFIPKGKEVKGVVGLCHGFSDSTHGFMMDFAIQLCQDGFVVLTMDVEGHGLSDGLHCAIHDLKTVACDLSDYFLSQLSILHLENMPFFVYGVSMGGANVFNLCTIPECKEFQARVTGAIMCAPMVKIADEMKPPALVISAMSWLADLMPHAPVTPVPDILNKCFREPAAYEIAKQHPLHYSKKPRLQTGLTMLAATEDINARMEELTTPILILHGGDDIVTDPKLSQVLHDRCSSTDKTITIYPKAWHDMLFGEPEYLKKIIYADITSWLTTRCDGYTASGGSTAVSPSPSSE